jgi:hypothetical protein
MVDRRRYTETKTMQFAWSLAALVVGAVAALVDPALVGPVPLLAWGATWLVGLLALGYRERRHWRHLVANSNFERGASAGVADLHQLRHGQSVAVSTDVPGVLSATHTVVSGGIAGVDAQFTITLEHAGEGAGDEGVATGNPTLDDAWVIEGGEKNVGLLLSTDVQSALMDVTVPATVTATGERVVLRVPFTRLTAAELAACAEAVAQIARRLERVGRGQASPTA